ncbi:hypothetical protein Droror1_Dr00001874 [Drosera rotundifolia]
MAASAGGGDVLPLVAMLVVQVGYAGMNIIAKLAMDDGMDPFVFVAYRQLFATFAISPFAYFLERKTRPRITKKILLWIFLCSLFGASINLVLYFTGLKNTTATIACAIGNTLPVFTFLLAVLFRLESVGIKSRSGQAKVLGTLLCVGGAMLLSFYHGHKLDLGKSGIKWKYLQVTSEKTKSYAKINFVSGPLVLLASTISWSLWFIVQAKLSKEFSAPYTSTALICFMASIECFVVAACTQHKAAKWSLASHIRLTASLYTAIVSSAVNFCLMSWTINRKGPLYVSVFSPLLLIMVAVLSWALLNEQLFVGTAVGSFLIILGLYTVLWGKKKESKATSEEETKKESKAMSEEDTIEGSSEEDIKTTHKEQPNQGLELV